MAKKIGTTNAALRKLIKAMEEQEPKEREPYDPAKQVEGLKKRIDATGMDAEKETDSRNFVERALNLRENQNPLFDFFEVINRPQQALFGGMKSSLQGDEFMQGAKAGIKGDSYTRFKEILHEIGFEDSEKLGVDDVLGFAGDVFIDPLQVPFLPGTAGSIGKIARATKKLDNAKDTLNILQKSAQASGKTVDATNKILKAQKVVENSEKVLKGLQKQKLISPLRYSMRGVARGGSWSVKTLDNSVGNVLTRLDVHKVNTALKKGQITGAKRDAILQQAEKAVGYFKMSKSYRGIKETISSTFNGLANIPGSILRKSKELEASHNLAIERMKFVVEEYTNGTFPRALKQMSKLKGFESLNISDDILAKAAKNIKKLTPSEKQAYDAYQTTSKAVERMVGDLIERGNLDYSTTILEQMNDLDAFMNLGVTKTERDFYENFIRTFFDDVDDDFFKGLWADPQEIVDQGYKGLGDIDQAAKGTVTVQRMKIDKAKELKARILEIANRTDDNKVLIKASEGVEARTVKEAQEALNARYKQPRYYSKEENKIFARLMGWKTDADGNIMLTKAGEPMFKSGKKTAEQKAWQKLVTDTQDVMGRLGDETNNLGANYEFNKGYLKHVRSTERSSIPDKQLMAVKSWADTSELSGKTQVMHTRSWQTSKKEANKLAKSKIDHLINEGVIADEHVDFWKQASSLKLFEDEVTTSFADFIKEVPKQTKQSLLLQEVLAESMFDERVFRVAEKGSVAPRGFDKVNKEALLRKLDGMEAFVGDKAAVQKIKSTLKNRPGNVYYLDKNISSYIGALQDKVEPQEMMEVVSRLNNMFKRNKLLSPGFQLRNFVGNWSRAWLAGMPTRKMVTYGKRADKVLRNGDELLKKATLKMKLNKSEVKMLEEYIDFIKQGFATTGRNLHDLPEELFKKAKVDLSILDKMARINGDANWGTDKRFRLAMYTWAKENPEVLERFGTTDPADYVRFALFDYADLSYIEKTKIRNVIPFYTFTKKNLAYQFKNLFENTERYKMLTNAFDNLWLNVTDDESFESIEEYRRQNYWLPIPSLNEKGKYISLKSSLPTGNLGEFAEAPLKSIVQATAPYIRAPFEIVVNKQTFSGMPIQEFKGQKGFSLPIDRRGEYALSQFGLDVPTKVFVADPIKNVIQAARGEKPTGEALADGFLGSTYSRGSSQNTRERKAYDKLDQVRQLMSYYKQEGIDIVPLAEAENRERNQMLQANIRKLRQLSQLR